MSTLASVLSLVIGIPFAFFTSRFHLPGKSLIKTLATLPLILPTFIGAEAWILLLGRNGLLSNLFHQIGISIPTIYGWQGIVLVFTLQFFPYVFLMVSASINSIDSSLEESARNLGANSWRVFRTVTLPIVTPSIFGGALIVFYLSIENFGVPTLIGEDYRVLAVQAYNEFISEMGGNPSMAGALSMILLSITLLVTMMQKYWVERRSYAMSLLRPPEMKRLKPFPTFCIRFFCASLVFLSLFPFLVVILSSVTKTQGPVMYFGQFSLKNLANAFQVAPRPIFNSFFMATAATLIGVVFGLAVSYLVVRRRGPATYLLDLLIMLPLIIAGTVLGIALAVTYNKGRIVLTGTWMILVLAYFIRKVPFSIKTTSSILQQIDASIEEASINLGCSASEVISEGHCPGDVARNYGRSHYHVGDYARRTEFYYCSLLRSLDDYDRPNIPVYRQWRFRPCFSLRHDLNYLCAHSFIYSKQNPRKGTDNNDNNIVAGK